jgi:hypothetical protein
VIGIALGLFLTLRPTGTFRTLSWMPRAIEEWADGHGRIRNVPAFALLAVPCLIVVNGRRARRKAILALAGFVAVTEFAQCFIPNRMFEWQDIACGWAGLLLSWGLFEYSFRLAWRFRNTVKPQPAPATTSAKAPVFAATLAADQSKQGSTP